MARVALFTGLITDENQTPVDMTMIGGEAFYVVNDAGFERHIRSEVVDRQVIAALQEDILNHREAVVRGILDFWGQKDLFTKAAIESSIDQMDENLEALFRTGLPEESRSWLGLMGFQVMIDKRGNIVELDFPTTPPEN